jgi:hypothetical protein
VSAISSHPIGQKFITPPTSLEVQRTYADGHSKMLILQSRAHDPAALVGT